LQGKIVLAIGSLAALMLISRIGWHCLRPWGWAAGWLGALSPLAITGNSNCLAHGQFSILCMGLISLQWLLIKRNRPRSAGLCWGLAMVKPQIALTFGLPLLRRRHLQGLLLGSALLLGLTAAALTHTDTSPQEFLISWLQVLPGFIAVGNRNGLAALLTFWPSLRGISLAWLVGLLLTAAAIVAVLTGWLLQRLNSHGIARSLKPETQDLAGVCAIIGFVGFYHLNYDNIMLYPALLACWRQTLMDPRSGHLLLSVLMTLSVWTPQTLLDAVPGSRELQTLIWIGVGVVLLQRVLRGGQGVSALAN
jgi:hypothetical protein